MNLGKKLITIASITGMLVLSTSVPAKADWYSGVSATGYGVLNGAITSSYGYTYVSYNNDNAYVTFKWEAQNSAGTTLGSGSKKTSRGVGNTDLVFFTAPTNTYTLFGSHGVQGGTSYNAVATYTETQL